MVFTYVTVTRDYDYADKAEPTGFVSFMPTKPMQNGGKTIAAATRRAELDSNGSISIVLAANTDPGTTGAGGYFVTEEIAGQLTRQYYVTIPHDQGSTIDLSTLDVFESEPASTTPLSAHLSALDPHPNYLTSDELDLSAYATDADLAAHTAAANPHPGYATDSDLTSGLSGKANTSHGHAIADTTGLQSAIDGKASATHNHDGSYSLTGHNHDSSYPTLNHNHDGSYPALNHNHDADYSDIVHDHDADYAGLVHNHNANYATLAHNHDGSYQAVGEQSFNVKDYGALGDNSADDTTEIQAAINAAAAVGGGIVFFPPGTYRVSVPLLVKDKVRLVGSSRSASVIQAAAVFTGDHVIRLGAGTGIVFGSTVEWLRIHANDSVNYCVYTTEAQELSGVFNCLLSNFRHSGFYGAGGRYFTIQGSELYGSSSGWTYGVRLASVTGPIMVSRLTINSNGGASALGTAGVHVTSTRVILQHIHGERLNDSVVLATGALGSITGVDATTDVAGHAVRILSGNGGGVTVMDASSLNDEKTGRSTTSFVTFYAVGANGTTKPVITESSLANRWANAQQFTSSITHVRNLVTATTTSAALDLALGVHQQLTLQSNVTSLTISNNADGMIFLLRVVQDATGSRTITWPSTVKWAGGGTAPTLATSANRSDIFQFLCMGGNFYEISRSLNLP